MRDEFDDDPRMGGGGTVRGDVLYVANARVLSVESVELSIGLAIGLFIGLGDMDMKFDFCGGLGLRMDLDGVLLRLRITSFSSNDNTGLGVVRREHEAPINKRINSKRIKCRV